jgi:predicted site-specific integrase-resolvase
MTIEQQMQADGYERATVVASRLGISRSTLSRWAKLGVVRSRKPRPKYLWVHTKDVERELGVGLKGEPC